VRAKVSEGSPGGRSETKGLGFVKQVDFKPGVKEGVMGEQSGETEEEEVVGKGIGESKMEELVLEWGWRDTLKLHRIMVSVTFEIGPIDAMSLLVYIVDDLRL